MRIGRPQGFSVQAVDRQARRRVRGGRHVPSTAPRIPCSGLNNATSFTPGACASKSIVLRRLPIDSRLIGDQPDALPSQRREVLRFKHINSRQSVSAGCSLCRGRLSHG